MDERPTVRPSRQNRSPSTTHLSDFVELRIRLDFAEADFRLEKHGPPSRHNLIGDQIHTENM